MIIVIKLMILHQTNETSPWFVTKIEEHAPSDDFNNLDYLP